MPIPYLLMTLIFTFVALLAAADASLAKPHYHAEHPEVRNSSGNATEREAAILTALVKEPVITQAQAEAFTAIHDRLGSSGLMP